MDLLQIKLRKIIDILTRRLEVAYRERCEIMVEDTFPSHDIKFTISIPKINAHMVQIYPNDLLLNIKEDFVADSLFAKFYSGIIKERDKMTIKGMKADYAYIDEVLGYAGSHYNPFKLGPAIGADLVSINRCVPNIKDVIFNNPATIVIWEDGEKTVVKCQEGDIYDPEKGLAMAITKRALGNKGNYCEELKKWLPEDYEAVTSVPISKLHIELKPNNIPKTIEELTAALNMALVHSKEK